MEDEIQTPVVVFKRKRHVVDLSSSDEDEVQQIGHKAGSRQNGTEDAITLRSDSENTQDSDIIVKRPGRRRVKRLTTDDEDDDELAVISSNDPIRPSASSSSRNVLQDEKQKKALAILKERQFNSKLDESELLEFLKKTNFDVVKAERQIKQEQADRIRAGLLPTKTNPQKKQYISVKRDNSDEDESDVQPMIARPQTYSKSDNNNPYLNAVAKGSAPSASATLSSALLSDDEDDDPKPLVFKSFFSQPSAIRIPLPGQRHKPTPKPKGPRQKRKFGNNNKYESDDEEDEEEDSEDDSFINDDSDEEVALSDDEDEGIRIKKKSSKHKTGHHKKRSRVVNKKDILEDELSRITDSEDEYDDKEEILSSSDEDVDAVPSSSRISPKTAKKIKRSEKQDNLRIRVVQFMNEATLFELQTINGVSKKKADQVVNLRPFVSYGDLKIKLEVTKGLSTDIINDSLEAIRSRDVIMNLMKECENLSSGITEKVANIKEARQPMILNKDCVLKQYQLIGLNWLVLMHEKKINAILADEMGLGKTIQVIALLAYLKEKFHNYGPHLIVVPASTLDNWDRELAHWCKHLDVLVYHGSQKERMETRIAIMNGGLKFEIILTTYNMVFSEDDKKLFKKYKFQYIVFDEAHLLKNMKTNRYAQLMQINSHRRLLLTGTPLQNNLLELMSLLIFTMPDLFSGRTEQVKAMFTFNNFTCKGDAVAESECKTYEQERIAHAKKIMKPFILRRLKADVLQQLPPKTVVMNKCIMTKRQQKLYDDLVSAYQKDIEHDLTIIEEVDADANDNEEVRELKMGDGHVKSANRNGVELKRRAGASMIMNLRKVANHPLLIRDHYTDAKLKQMSKLMLREPTHCDANPDLIEEDMSVYSDFELHQLCLKYNSLKRFLLPQRMILDSGKLLLLDEILPQVRERGEKALLFSQFCMTLDIIEVYMQIRGYQYMRLDGSTRVDDRLDLIDEFNREDSEVFVFLLTTKAGGVGINLTAATTAILHDIDFNPYNDKQAEDRCHRMGQTKEVTIHKFVTQDSIEEGILSIAEHKLRLGNDMCVARKASQEEAKNDMKSLLKGVLGI